MSDGFSDSMKWLIADRDALDGKDPWDDEEVTEIIKDLNKDLIPKYPWLDWAGWKPRSYSCDCGARVAKTTCANWCSSKRI